MQRKLTALGAALGLAVLILDGQTALAGAQEGLELCIRTVIPSLFPFFLLSTVLNGSFSGTGLPGWLFGLPRGCSGLLVPMLLGGYPVGAQSALYYYNKGILRKDQSEALLAFCNQAGPSFLFGILGRKLPVWPLWAILILGAFTAARFLPVPGEANGNAEQPTPPTPTQAMGTAIGVMASVCGWIVIFRVLIAFLNRWFLWALPLWCRVLIIGLLELSNGCTMLDMVPSEALRFVLAVVLLSLGGLCVTMQTASVVGPLSLKRYFLGKAIQTITVLLLCLGYLRFGWLVFPVFALVMGIAPLVAAWGNAPSFSSRQFIRSHSTPRHP